jgi:hypothetical protein
MDRTILSRETPRSISPSQKSDVLLNMTDQKCMQRFYSPRQKRISLLDTTVYEEPFKVTRIVEGHLMPIRDKSMSFAKNNFI